MNIVILSNTAMGTYNLRREFIDTLISENHQISLVVPYGEELDYFKNNGCNLYDISFERHGMNIFKELFLYRKYLKILSGIKPDLVITYTTKQNIYGGMACAKLKIPYVVTVTGIGNAMQKGFLKKILMMMYKIALRKAECVFFQNKLNLGFFQKEKIYNGKCVLVPGSGVNTQYHFYREYPQSAETIKFLFIGRLNTDKGIYELFEVASRIKKEYPYVAFHIVGSAESEQFMADVKKAEEAGDVIYHGEVSDVRNIIGECHCTVLPSYHEGMANVLLESASAGRPIIATDINGCCEVVEDGKTGFLCKVKDSDDLYKKIISFIELSQEEKMLMGKFGREKMIKEFSRDIVIEKYMSEINKIQRSKS